MVIKLHHVLLGFLVFTLITSLARNSIVLFNNVPFFDQLKTEYDKEKAKNESLKLKAAKAKDPYEIEKLLRNKLGLVKDGEKIIVIPSTSPSLYPSPTP